MCAEADFPCLLADYAQVSSKILLYKKPEETPVAPEATAEKRTPKRITPIPVPNEDPPTPTARTPKRIKPTLISSKVSSPGPATPNFSAAITVPASAELTTPEAEVRSTESSSTG